MNRSKGPAIMGREYEVLLMAAAGRRVNLARLRSAACTVATAVAALVPDRFYGIKLFQRKRASAYWVHSSDGPEGAALYRASADGTSCGAIRDLSERELVDFAVQVRFGLITGIETRVLALYEHETADMSHCAQAGRTLQELARELVCAA
jgi:hypothetical protein